MRDLPPRPRLTEAHWTGGELRGLASARQPIFARKLRDINACTRRDPRIAAELMHEKGGCQLSVRWLSKFAPAANARFPPKVDLAPRGRQISDRTLAGLKTGFETKLTLGFVPSMTGCRMLFDWFAVFLRC